jgi:hypothetical protein
MAALLPEDVDSQLPQPLALTNNIDIRHRNTVILRRKFKSTQSQKQHLMVVPVARPIEFSHGSKPSQQTKECGWTSITPNETVEPSGDISKPDFMQQIYTEMRD